MSDTHDTAELKAKERWVVVASFLHAHEAALAQAMVQNEGVECTQKDEFMVAAQPLYANAIGGIKLLVKDTDAEVARAALIESGYLSEGVEETDFLDVLRALLPVTRAGGRRTFSLSPAQRKRLVFIVVAVLVVAFVLLM
ncbi:MAG: DUF2007 domain-containing protein [Flavobacteriales bacterium]|nr:MAG: DUF2007 domain-containing protein [Flavobacteriales bacterium]